MSRMLRHEQSPMVPLLAALPLWRPALLHGLLICRCRAVPGADSAADSTYTWTGITWGLMAAMASADKCRKPVGDSFSAFNL